MFGLTKRLKARYDNHVFNMTLLNRNKTGDMDFFLHVIEFEHRVYENFIFMPNFSGYLDKLKSIGFVLHEPRSLEGKNKPKTTGNFDFYYCEKLNIGIHIIPEIAWSAMIVTIDVMNKIYSASVTSEFQTIEVIFNALSKYKQLPAK